MNITHDQLIAEFKRQINLCSGIKKSEMIKMVNELHPDIEEAMQPEISKRDILQSLKMAHDNLTNRKYKNARMCIGVMIRMLEREISV